MQVWLGAFFSHWLVSGLVRGRAACAGLMVWFGLYCLCLGQSGRRLGCRWGAVGRGACYGAGLSGSLACRRAVSSAAGCAIGGPRGWATIGYFFFARDNPQGGGLGWRLTIVGVSLTPGLAARSQAATPAAQRAARRAGSELGP